MCQVAILAQLREQPARPSMPAAILRASNRECQPCNYFVPPIMARRAAYLMVEQGISDPAFL